MYVKKNLKLWVAVFALALPLFFALNAGATTNCYDCHSSGTPTQNKADFQQTGHANMLRKVTAGTELLGPNGEHYSSVKSATTYAPGTVDWLAGTLSGSTMYYLMDGWLGFINGGNPAPYAVTTTYSCGACHTTNWSANCSNTLKTTMSACTPTWTWAPDAAKAPTTDGIPTSVIDKISGSWSKAGVQCERCHDGLGADITAGPPDPSHTSTKATGVAINDLCGECHTSSHSNGFLNSPHARFTPITTGTPTVAVLAPGTNKWAGLSDTVNYESHFTLYYGGGCTSCHDVHKSMVVTSHETDTWGTGNVHYCSKSSVSKNSGEAACVAAGGTWITQTGPMKACIACHNGAYAKTTINHPKGAGTPETDCAVCHMPGGLHLFRINTDLTYTYEIDLSSGNTCTDQGGHVGTSHGATICLDATGAHMGKFAAEGTFLEAEWNDLDMTCGQCHGGSSTTTANGAMRLSKATLAAYAKGMHGLPPAPTTAPTASFTAPVVSLGTRVTITDTSTFATNAPTKKVTVNWGDGTTGIITAATSTYHDYSILRIRSYLITLTASDGTANPVSKASARVAVPQKLSVSGSVSGGATRVALKVNGHTRKVAAGSSFTFTVPYGSNVVIRAYKYGTCFNDITVSGITADLVSQTVTTTTCP